MRIALFCHSLLSDWNHGNAHFLRGVSSELLARGHDVRIFEPRDGWSITHLIAQEGVESILRMRAAYPTLDPIPYDPAAIDIDEALDDVDLVIVHEWNDPELVSRIGRHRLRGGKERLLFHDTHHRMVTAKEEMRKYDLSGYDGVLAFGEVIRELYLSRGLARRAWTWHEAADTRVFFPKVSNEGMREIAWIGNWGDEERTSELREFLIDPCEELGLRGTVHGVRYPQSALAELEKVGLEYRGWLANFDVPDVFASHRVTVHVPRRPYANALPGIPTIRPFEAMACGIPLISAPWEDSEKLFIEGRDYLMAHHGREMKEMLRMVLEDESLARSLSENGRERILSRHSCAHRATELLEIAASLGIETSISSREESFG